MKSPATPAEIRLAVQEAADDLTHPWKVDEQGDPRSFGRIVSSEGAAGVYANGAHLIARGDTYELSLAALARYLDLKIRRRKEPDVEVVIPDYGIDVDEVDAGWFWLFANPEAKGLPEPTQG